MGAGTLERAPLDLGHPSLRNLNRSTARIYDEPVRGLENTTFRLVQDSAWEVYGHYVNPKKIVPNEANIVERLGVNDEQDRKGIILYPGFLGTGRGMAPATIALFNEMQPDMAMSFASAISPITADADYSPNILDHAATLAGYTFEMIQRYNLKDVRVLGGLSLGSQAAIAALPLLQEMLKRSGNEAKLSEVILVCPSGVVKQSIPEFFSGMLGYARLNAEIAARHPSYYQLWQIERMIDNANQTNDQVQLERLQKIQTEMIVNFKDTYGLSPEEITKISEIDQRMERIVQQSGNEKLPKSKLNRLQRQRNAVVRKKVERDTAGAETQAGHKQIKVFGRVLAQIIRPNGGIRGELPDSLRKITGNVALVFSEGDKLFPAGMAERKINKRRDREGRALLSDANTLYVYIQEPNYYGHNSHGVSPEKFAGIVSQVQGMLDKFPKDQSGMEETVHL